MYTIVVLPYRNDMKGQNARGRWDEGVRWVGRHDMIYLTLGLEVWGKPNLLNKFKFTSSIFLHPTNWVHKVEHSWMS